MSSGSSRSAFTADHADHVDDPIADQEEEESCLDSRPSPTDIESLLQRLMKQDEKVNRADMLVEKCGVFGCIANGDWPTNLGVASIVGLGLVGLQHR